MTKVAAEIDSFFAPRWPAPNNVKALITTRQGGVSTVPFDSNNLAQHVSDDPKTVASNRLRLAEHHGWQNEPQWLEQVHGIKVVEAAGDGRVRTADGCISDRVEQVCAVLTADCLPLLMCDRQGTQVAAVHAGWRGLAAGVVREAVSAFKSPASDLMVYLGPAIGANHFEVGIDVLEAFFDSASSETQAQAIVAAFQPSAVKPMKYQADLYALARAELQSLGVTNIYGGDYCTYEDSTRFYSYRRDGETGRMASLIWLT